MSTVSISSLSIECGEVTSQELPVFLSLMTEAFHLPPQPTAQVFYADPYFNLSNKRVLRVAGEIASCLTLVEREALGAGGAFPVIGLCGVSTAPHKRRRGYAAALIENTLTRLYQQEIPFALLNPVDAPYYRRLGWEFVIQSERLVTSPRCLSFFPETSRVRSLTQRDVYSLNFLYDTATEKEQFTLTRDKKRWEFLFSYLSAGVLYTSRTGTPEGYLIYEDQETGEGKPSPVTPLKVLEMRCLTPPARRALLGFLSQTPASLIQVEGQLETHLQDGFLTALDYPGDKSTLPHIETLPTIMGRIVHFGSALSLQSSLLHALRSGPKAGALQCVLEDPLSPGGKQECLLGTKTGAASPSLLFADIQTWTRILFGTISGEEALSFGLLSASDERAGELAAECFPRARPFLSPLDYF